VTDVRHYLREWAMPHVLCPGCAHGIVLHGLLDAISRLGLGRDEVAMVAGIGCSSRLVGYVDFCTLHTTHGRAPAFATGLKLARPDLTVIVLSGDGDGLAIGGNHLIHAARRNVDMTLLLFNNSVYGMTGGQAAPTTPAGSVATTALSGTIEQPFDACRLLEAAGASFVARVVAAEPLEVAKVVEQGVSHQGFSFIEVISDCPEYFGRYNRLGRGAELLGLMTRSEDRVADRLAEKQAVPHVPAPNQVPSLRTGVLYREPRAVFTGRVGAAA